MSMACSQLSWELVYTGSRFSLRCGNAQFACLVGAAGLVDSATKREGDNKTPRGKWKLTAVYYRADRVEAPESTLPQFRIKPDMGWCDDPASIQYNRYVTLPRAERYEHLYRDDTSYDLVVTLNHNQSPVVTGLGSAIFIHCIAPGKQHTAGCIALEHGTLQNLLRGASADTYLIIK